MSIEMKLSITGMTCNHCVAHARKNLEAVPGVSVVEVSLESGTAVVKGDVDAAALLTAVKDAGYEAVIDE